MFSYVYLWFLSSITPVSRDYFVTLIVVSFYSNNSYHNVIK